MRVHDAHCHFFTRRFFEALTSEKYPSSGDETSDAIIRQLGWDPPGPAEELADRWVAELDRHEVGRAALIASVPGDETSVLAAVARHPSRFVGFFMVNPRRPDAEVSVVQALEQGLRTVCLFPAMHRFALDDVPVIDIVEQVARRPGCALFVHCGVLSIGVRKKLGLPSRFDVRLGHPAAVQALASAWPAMPVIVPHFGAGYFQESLMAADMAPNIHFDTSSSNGWMRYHAGLTLRDVFARTLDVVGSDRILFGTDSSFFPRGWQRGLAEAQHAVLDELGVDPDTRTKIFAGNFDRLFGTGPQAPLSSEVRGQA
jgi:predicted TIM-barrel fold metal-dependent hydrolase